MAPVILSPFREGCLIFAICLAQLLSLAGVAQTVAPLPIIGHYFGVTSQAQLPWLTAAYSLTSGTFVLPAGRLGDMYGHKRMYILGFLLYGVFSAVAGLSIYVPPRSQGYIMLAICRALQGIGPAILVPNALALVGRTYATEELESRKHLCLGLFAASAPIGFVLGALFSAIFSQLAFWPWMFWAQALICCAAGTFAWAVVPRDRVAGVELGVLGKKEEVADSPSEDLEASADAGGGIEVCNVDEEEEDVPASEANKKVQFDTLGAVTGVSGLILFNFAWNQAPLETWTTPYVLITLLLGIAFLGLFGFIEFRVASEPLVPLQYITYEAALALTCVFCGWASFGVWMYYWWRLQEILRGYLPLTVVAQNCTVIPSGLAASLTTSYLLSRIPVERILLASMCCFLTGMALLASVPLHQSFWIQTFLSLLVMPGGLDMSFPSAAAIISRSLPRKHQGTAASFVVTVVNYSISLSLGVAGSIVKHIGGGADVATAGPPGPMGQAGLYRGGDVKGTAVLLTGFRSAWYFGISLDVVGLLIAAGFVAAEVWKQRK